VLWKGGREGGRERAREEREIIEGVVHCLLASSKT